MRGSNLGTEVGMHKGGDEHGYGAHRRYQLQQLEIDESVDDKMTTICIGN